MEPFCDWPLFPRSSGQDPANQAEGTEEEEEGRLCLSDCRTSAPLDAAFAAAGLRCALGLADAALGLWAEVPSLDALGRRSVLLSPLARHADQWIIISLHRLYMLTN